LIASDSLSIISVLKQNNMWVMHIAIGSLQYMLETVSADQKLEIIILDYSSHKRQ